MDSIILSSTNLVDYLYPHYATSIRKENGQNASQIQLEGSILRIGTVMPIS